MIWTSDTTKKAMKLHSFLVRRRLGVHFTHHASRHGLSRAVKFCAGWNKNCSSDPYEICCGCYMGGICAMRDGRSLDSQCVNQLPKYIKNTQNSSSVPLEFPKLANAQPSNFGRLENSETQFSIKIMFILIHFKADYTMCRAGVQVRHGELHHSLSSSPGSTWAWTPQKRNIHIVHIIYKLSKEGTRKNYIA